VSIREIRGRFSPKRRLKRLKKRARNGQLLEWGQIEGKDPPAMFASDSFLISQAYNQSKASRALQQYRMARLRGQLNHLWSALTGRSRSLHRLPKTTAGG
jgi:hypothetical protein